MSFDKELRSMIDEIEVPEELMPANIAAMLKGECPAQRSEAAAEEKRKNITASHGRSNRTIIMRTLAAAAACIALAVGFTALSDEITEDPIVSNEVIEIEDRIEYEAVQVHSYDELYNIYTGIYLRNSETDPIANGDGVEIRTDETAITETETAAVTESTEAETSSPLITPADTETDGGEDQVTSAAAMGFTEADIIKSDDSNIYYISGGRLYVVSKADMSVTADISAGEKPVDIFVTNGTVVLVSEENASPSDDSVQKNVVVDIYSITDTAEHIKTYKQNGEFTSTRMSDSGTLYLVTGYSDYRKDPLDENADIEKYVPGYYINGEKKYVAPEDITVPANANSTDYTVVSSIDCGADGVISVKAVLGSSVNAVCGEDALYIAGIGRKDGVDYTIITSFALSGDGLAYKASGSVEGALVSRYSMNVYDGLFRIGCRTTDENGFTAAAVYVLDDKLKVVKSAGRLLVGNIPDAVRFDENYASIYVNGESEPSLAVDLSRDDPVQADCSAVVYGAYVSRFSSTKMCGITAVADENGVSSAIKLEMYDADTGILVNDVTFAEFSGVDSPAFYDKKAMLIDETQGIIGIPVYSVNEFGVKNQYFVYRYTDIDGFVLMGTVEYNDIDDSCRFDRAVITDGIMYIMGCSRMVTVQLSDMTVTGTFDLNAAPSPEADAPEDSTSEYSEPSDE